MKFYTRTDGVSSFTVLILLVLFVALTGCAAAPSPSSVPVEEWSMERDDVSRLSVPEQRPSHILAEAQDDLNCTTSLSAYRKTWFGSEYTDRYAAVYETDTGLCRIYDLDPFSGEPGMSAMEVLDHVLYMRGYSNTTYDNEQRLFIARR